MVILSIDLGDSRTGVAVCDKTETLATPVCVLFEKYIPKVYEKIKNRGIIDIDYLFGKKSNPESKNSKKKKVNNKTNNKVNK